MDLLLLLLLLLKSPQIKKTNSANLSSYGLFEKISKVPLNMDEVFSKKMNFQVSE